MADSALSDRNKVQNQKIYLDIADAQAVVDKSVRLGPSGVIEGIDSPQIGVKKQGADHVRIIRCAASYRDRMVNLSGEDIRHLAGKSDESTELEWIWVQAREDRNYCKIVGTNIVMDLYSDLTAPKGEFFYIVNPCISKENSLTRREGCSNRISLTNTVRVANSLTKDLQTKATDLAVAESALNAEMINALSLAKKIEVHLRACEDKVAQDQQMLNFKKGLVQLGAMAIGAAIGGGIGGANLAVMGGQMASMVGGVLFYSHVLKWPPVINNECIDPNVISATGDQSGGKYEGEFQVQTMLKKLAGMMEPESGSIAIATRRVERMLQQMHEIDIKVLTVDQAKVRASRLGIDISNPETFSIPGKD